MEQSKTTDASGGGNLYDKLMALRLQAAEFADEAADNTPLGKPTSEFEASERGKAGAYYQAAQMVKAAHPSADEGLLQQDLVELLGILGMSDHARPQSPHEVFQEALRVARQKIAALASAPPSPTPEAGSDLAKLSARAAKGEWLLDVQTYHDEDGGPSEDHTEGVMVLDNADQPDSIVQCSEANAAFIVALVNTYRSGRLVEASPSPPPAEDLAGQGEPVTSKVRKALLMAREAVLQNVQSYRPWAEKIAGRVNPWQPVLDALDEAIADTAAPAPSRPADREEIARLIRPGAFEELSPDPYGPSVELLEIGRAPGRAEALAKANAILAFLALRDAPRDGGDGTQAARDVLAERRRQVEGERWTPDHDDAHSNGEMAYAAAAYAIHAGYLRRDRCDPRLPPAHWPWSVDWWKPTTARRDLVKAGALILAEIERLDRLPSPNAGDATQDRQGGGR